MYAAEDGAGAASPGAGGRGWTPPPAAAASQLPAGFARDPAAADLQGSGWGEMSRLRAEMQQLESEMVRAEASLAAASRRIVGT